MFSLGGDSSHDLEHERLMRTISLGIVLSGTWANRPPVPFANQRYVADDRGFEYKWNGASWLSTQLIFLTLQPQQVLVGGAFPQTTSDFTISVPSYAVGGGIYIERVAWNFTPITVAQSVTNYYTPTLQAIDAATNAITTVTRTSGTIDTKGPWAIGFFAPLETVYGQAVANALALRFRLTPTASPGTFQCQPVVQLRLVG